MKPKEVIAIRKDGKKCKYRSLTKAAKATGANIGAIWDCCNLGKSSTAKGFIWRYAEGVICE